MCCSSTPQLHSTTYSLLHLQLNMEQIYSKRIQFHIDAATLLPSAKRAGKAPVRPDAYVSVQIVRDLSDADHPRAATGRVLQTTAVKGEMTNPRWEQNLEYMDLSGQPAVVFEIMQRSGRLGRRSSLSVAKTEPYPLSTLLAMQGGNAFDRSASLFLSRVYGISVFAHPLSFQISSCRSTLRPCPPPPTKPRPRAFCLSISVNLRLRTRLMKTSRRLPDARRRSGGYLRIISKPTLAQMKIPLSPSGLCAGPRDRCIYIN
ncbi:unnamed protein product, partial [Mycena citricolor]